MGPSHCTQIVLAYNHEGTRTWTVDGQNDANEYYGAHRFPYRNARERLTSGDVLVTVEEAPSGDRLLHIFMDDVPIPLDGHGLAVYVDTERYEDHPEEVSENDRAYVVHVESEEIGDTEFWVGDGSGGWTVTEPPEPWSAALGQCRVESRPSPQIRFCDVEFEIQAESLHEGAVGLAIGDRLFESSFPPDMTSFYSPTVDRSVDRTEYQTLLLVDEPQGVPFSIVSWNVARFTDFISDIRFGADEFDGTSLEAQAELLSTYDIIAVQELWDEDEAITLLGLLNGLRDPARPEYNMIKGPDRSWEWSPYFKDQITATADELHGGIWIYTTFDVIDNGSEIFTHCRGIDCLRAKGVMWTRLALDPPGPVPGECIPVEGERLPPGCPTPGTSEMYIDVFNTHMQASGDGCLDEEWLRMLAEWFDGGFLTGHIEDDVHCHSWTNHAVRMEQLLQIANFVNGKVSGNPRQALLVGDFNVDGQSLNYNVATNAYGELVERLGILAPGADPTADEPDVTINPFPGLHSFDIDRGDLAREDESLVCSWNPTPPMGTCVPPLGPGTGTSIGSGPAAACTDPMETCRDADDVPDGGNRVDYILVRSGVADRLDYYLARQPDLPVYQSPWPELPGVPPGPLTYAGPPTRLSDHKPVVANLMLVSARDPAPFYPDVSHEFVFEVTSADASGTSDCWGIFDCDPVDLTAQMSGASHDGSTWNPFPGTAFWTAHSCEGWQIDRYARSCMNDWVVSDLHHPGVDWYHRGYASLWDVDDSSPNDQYPTTPGGYHPEVILRWDGRVLEYWGYPSGGLFRSVPILHSDPWAFCTKEEPVRMCIRVSYDELPR